MKRLLATALLLQSFAAFSQSYMLLQNGELITVDKAGFVYDLNHFVLPYKVTYSGGQYLGEEETLMVLDERGFLYRKDESFRKVTSASQNFFITSDNVLHTVDSQGMYYKYDKIRLLIRKVDKVGGTFFTTMENRRKNEMDLYTVNSAGVYFKVSVPGLNPADITVFGGKYFMTSKGVIYTVSKDGHVFAKPEIKAAALTLKGGNYFADNTGKFFTVSETGILKTPILPATLKIEDIEKMGSNLLIDKDARLFVVDHEGNVYERSIPTMDFSKVSIISK